MKKAWLVMELFFAFVGASLVLAACVLFIPKAEKHDVWDILTAIGTVGAAVAAVWIATNEARRRKKEALEVAKITAAGMVWKLDNFVSQTRLTLEWLNHAQQVDFGYERFHRYGSTIGDCAQWTMQDLLPLVPLPRQCAVKLASAADQVHICSYMLVNADDETDESAGISRMKAARDISKILQQAQASLCEALEICREAADAANSC